MAFWIVNHLFEKLWMYAINWLITKIMSLFVLYLRGTNDICTLKFWDRNEFANSVLAEQKTKSLVIHLYSHSLSCNCINRMKRWIHTTIETKLFVVDGEWGNDICHSITSINAS